MSEVEESQGSTMLTVRDIPTDQVVPNPDNPNEMSDADFNALCEAIDEEGWTNPLQVVQRGDVYSIVAGEHRWRAARVRNDPTVPCVLLDPVKFDEDRQAWVTVKDNVLHGKLNPEKFARLYEDMAARYDKEVLQRLMGFSTSDAFQKVYKETREGLPPHLQKALDDAKDEIRSIDDLSAVLNGIFREYGETLPSNFMVFSWGGKKVLWVRADKALWDLVKPLSDRVEDEGGDLAARLGELLTAGLEQEPPVLRPLSCPECVAGKHDNCDGQAWDNEKDGPVNCWCADRKHVLDQ